jgi:exonuclease VII small subunit
MANDVLARLAVRIDANTKQFGVALNALNQQLNKFGATVNAQTASISNFEKRVATIQRSLGSLGVAFGAFQIGTVIVDSIRRIADFEKQMDTVAAIAGATGEEFERLREDALRLGAASQFTATQVAELQTEFGRLGFTTDEIIAATEATIDLATATGEDLAKSADVAGSTIRAFGLSAEETGRVVDVMAESFNRTALGLDNFAESMKYVAPVARAANISVEETTALLGILADSGIRGSSAGTALRRIITDLAKDGRPLQERLKELAAQGLTLSGAMDEVGRTAQTALLVLTNNTDRVDKLTTSFNNAAGAAKETAAIMRDNLAGDIEKLTSAWDGFILSLDKSDGSLREVIQGLTQLVESITKIANSGFGEFVADWFRFTQHVPRFLLGVVDMFATWGDEIEITREDAGKLFYELNRLKQAAELEGKSELAQEYAGIIKELTDRFGDLRKEVGFVGPEIQKAIDPRILVGLDAKVIESTGIIARLEDQAKKLEEAIKNATSIEQIRQFQRELEGVNIQLDKIIKGPSTPPPPVKMPIEFPEPDLSLQEFSERILAIQPNVVIPVELDIPEDTEDTGLTAQLDAISERLAAFKEQVAATFQQGIGDVIAGFAEDLGNAASGVGNFGDNILEALAGFAKQFGSLLIATGVAKIAFDNIGLSGIGAVAAGAALIAAAQAVSNHLSGANKALARAGGVGGGGGGATRTPENFQTERAGMQIVLGGEFKIRNDDLVLALDKGNIKRQRLG